MKKKIFGVIGGIVVAVGVLGIANYCAAENMKTSTAIKSMDVTADGLYISLDDGSNLWISNDDLENFNLINPENIIRWNTNGEELSFITKNDYEFYAYKGN